MTARTGRQAYLDWVRGVAVLIMIEAHVLDAWTLAADRTRPPFGYAIILGGFGAPLFLFLAGLAAVLSAESKLRRTGNFIGSWRAVQKRGWQIFGLAFVFRLQSYVLSGGYSLVGLLKVDVLNIMGPALALTAFVGRLVRTKAARGILYLGMACAVSLLTPTVRALPQLAWLPDPLEWYFRPTPGRTNFTLFPWTGFVFAGACAGVALGTRWAAEHPRRVQVTLAVSAVLIVALAHAGSFLPSLHDVSDYWTTSPAFFFLRVGVLLLLLPIAYVWTHSPLRRKVSGWSPLEEFGRASLFVYWIHVEMVYGFVSRPWRQSLTLEQAFAAYVLFTVFLLSLVRMKSWLVDARGIYLTDSKSVI